MCINKSSIASNTFSVKLGIYLHDVKKIKKRLEVKLIKHNFFINSPALKWPLNHSRQSSIHLSLVNAGSDMVSTTQTYFLVSSLNKVSALCRHQAVRLELVQHFPLTHLWCVTWCCQGCRTSWSGPHDVTFSPSFTLYRLSNLPSTAVSVPRSSLHLLPAMWSSPGADTCFVSLQILSTLLLSFAQTPLPQGSCA